MTSQKTARSTAWLLWTGLVLAGLLVVILLSSGSQTSQAMNSYDLETSQADRVVDGSSINAATDAAFIVKKEASPGRPVHGEQVEYTVTFTNTGDAAGTLETISDTLDASLSFAGMQGRGQAWPSAQTAPGWRHVPATEPSGFGMPLLARS